MARDPDTWSNPLAFIPERFDVETTADKLNPYGYIPFSAGELTAALELLLLRQSIISGSRNCVGQKFAMLEVKSTISKVLRHFHVSVQPGFEPQDALELVIKSNNGVMIKLEKRVY